VASGGSAVDPAVVSELVRARRRDDRLTRLTDRERQALSLIAEGRSNRAIAEQLGITTKTLEGMTGSIFSKLGIEDDPDLNRRVVAVLLHLGGPGAAE
jgi:DNA-binding NarL/FixJ family response regulator